MNKTIVQSLLVSTLLSIATMALAIPTLQVGVPCLTPSTCGVYGNYTADSAHPTETDTALTSGNTLLVGGAFKSSTYSIGGKTGDTEDWSNFGMPLAFNGHGAVLMASVSNTLNTLTINGHSAFYTTTTNLFPNNHAPLGSANHFMFFDIGNFTKTADVVDNFASELPGGCTPGSSCADGQVMSLTIAGVSGTSTAWIHFDVMALVTNQTTTNSSVGLITTFESDDANNPGSKDVTWINPNPGSGGGEIPEPAMTLLIGVALVGWWFARRTGRKNASI